MAQRTITSLVFLVALLIATGTAQAHIPSRSPYESKPLGPQGLTFAGTVVPTGTACFASNIVFAVLQVAGFLYMAVVLRVGSNQKTPARRTWSSALATAFLLQLGITLLLLVFNLFIFVLLNIDSTCFHVNPSGLEVAAFFRHDIVVPTLVADALSFALAILLSRAMLAAVALHGNKWGFALLHASVFHPLPFPVGLLGAFMALVYQVRMAGTPRVRDALDLEYPP